MLPPTWPPRQYPFAQRNSGWSRRDTSVCRTRSPFLQQRRRLLFKFLSDGNTTVSSFSSPVPAPLRLRLQSSRVRFATNDLADCRSFFQ